MKDSSRTAQTIAGIKRLAAFPSQVEYLSTDIYYGMSFARLTPQSVLSRSKEGEPLCRLEDDEWFLPVFAFNVSDNPHFSFLPFYQVCDFQKHNVDICKKIFLMKMFAPNSKTGKPLRLASMHMCRWILLKMIEFCGQKNIKIEDVFESFDLFKIFQNSDSPQFNKILVALVRTLNGMSSIERGFPLNGEIFPYMQKEAKRSRKESQQYPIIPSRILLFKYKQYQSYIADFLERFDNISAFLERAAQNPFYGKHKNTHHNIRSRANKGSHKQLEAHLKSPVSFFDAIQENCLGPLYEKYAWSSAPSVVSFLTKVSHCAKNLIHLFTLMRDHEVRSLSDDCLEPVHGWNNDALYVAGITTKLYSAAKPHKWITTDAILKPIEVLRKIKEILSPYVDNPENYLFVSTAVHPVSNANSSKDSLVKKNSVEGSLEPIHITEADIQELEAIEPLRNWRSDPRYKVGKPWRITSHQFRRTMAVFCAQTGLITLPSLKRLLGHLTKVMSLYYSKGCSAENYYFNLMNPELAQELRKAKFEADGAMFIREVLHSTDKLFGIKGSEIMSQRSSTVWVIRALEETVLLVSQGLTSYTETPLGGCASPTPCNKRAHGNFFTCPGCLHLIGKDSVLNDTLAVMEFDLAELDPDSMEYKAEKQNLEDFIELRSRLIAKAS